MNRFTSMFKRYGKELIARDGMRCHYCGIMMTLPVAGGRPHDATVDHVIPRSKGGTHTLDNFVLACKSCNSKKGNT